MTAVLCSLFSSRKSAHSATIIFLLLIAVPSRTIALGPAISRVRAGLMGLARSEGREKVKSEDMGPTKDNTKSGHIRGSRLGATAGDDDEAWGDSDATIGFRTMFSIGEGGLWEPRSSTRCIPIPSGMALCQNIGYDTMRMPNLLGHDSPAEAVQQSVSWLPLLARECHPDARIFLCSLFAPICLDR